MLRTLSRVLVVVTACISLAWAGKHSHPPIANVKNGTYVGLHNDFYDVDYFLGMPFAHAPRLALPASLNTTFGVRNATELGPGCIEFSVCNFNILCFRPTLIIWF
jgi:triacylglycerol lipase